MKKLPIIFVTHDRTKLCIYTLEKIIQNLKYNGDIHIYIANDRSSSNHILAIKQCFMKYKFVDYTIISSNNTNYGMGYVLNQCIKHAFTYSNIIFTTEDDLILENTLNITPYVQILCDTSFAAIRFARCEIFKRSDTQYEELITISKTNESHSSYIYNLQCALRHKRIFDALGFYKENCSPKDVEIDMRNKYNKYTNFGNNDVLKTAIFKKFKPQMHDDPSLFFIHAGKTTIPGNKNIVPFRYAYLND